MFAGPAGAPHHFAAQHVFAAQGSPRRFSPVRVSDRHFSPVHVYHGHWPGPDHIGRWA